jgi:hypothetical protein
VPTSAIVLEGMDGWMDGWMDRFMHDSRDSGGDLRVSIGAVRLVDLACTYVGLDELILGRGSIRA